jgi:Asp-tRNA(Asn)/Glu-tRNA(Gln) amidotransferase A subunit family amidase
MDNVQNPYVQSGDPCGSRSGSAISVVANNGGSVP